MVYSHPCTRRGGASGGRAMMSQVSHVRVAAENEVAPIVRSNTLVSVRSYDQSDQCIYDLGTVCWGEEVDEPLRRALDDGRTAFVNIHTARPGCLLARVERTS